MTNRRTFIAGAGAFMTIPLWGEAPADEKPLVRLGLVTDIHHADREDAPWSDVTMYREALPRFNRAVVVTGFVQASSVTMGRDEQ